MHHFTLLDGEMVIDNPKDEKGQARRRYLVYDLVANNGESVVEVVATFSNWVFVFSICGQVSGILKITYSLF